MNINFSNINFYGYKSKFSTTLDKEIKCFGNRLFSQDYLLESLTSFCDKNMNPSRKLGSGYFSSVYRIDDKYVLKDSNNNKSHKLVEIIINHNQKFKNLKCYYGEAVATIVNKFGANLSILKNAYKNKKTVPAGIPTDFAKRNSYIACVDYYKNVYLPTFSNLPQKSYDNIARDCAELNKMCGNGNAYTFDYLNPNNFVLSGKTIRIIDDVGQASQKDKKNSIADLLSVFVSNIDLDYAEMFNSEIIKHRKTITKKLILAGAKEKLPVIGLKTFYDMWHDSIYLLDLDLSKEETINIASEIDDIIKNTNNHKERVEKVKQYLETTIDI